MGLLTFIFVKNYLLKIISIATFILFLLLSYPASIFAYSNNMSASYVLGQPNLTSNSAGISASSLDEPKGGMCVYNGRFVLVDYGNSRVLIWNSIPTSNGQPADVVVGQPNFTSGGDNTGGVSASTFDRPVGLACPGGKMIVVDEHNNRVLIWNSIPTVNNTPADVVIGQQDFTSNQEQQGGSKIFGATGSTIRLPHGVFSDGTKLYIADSGNQRILVYNQIPTVNNASADFVIGQYNLTTVNFDNSDPTRVTCGPNSIGGEAIDVYIHNGKLLVANAFAVGGNRVTIYNTVPTASGAQADLAIGQLNLTSCALNQGLADGALANSLYNPWGLFVDSKGRLIVGDYKNHRVLIYRSVPTVNGASADIVLGQPNFTANDANQGGSVAANTLSGARPVFAYENKIFVGDASNNRVLVFEDISKEHNLTLNNSPEGRDGGLLRLKGKAEFDGTPTISSVQYSINGGGFSGATPTDGSFNSTSEEFYFDFDPKSNQQRDSSGNLIDGYTVRVKSIDVILDETDNLFYFSPFNLNEPLNDTITTLTNPTFDFSVIKQRSILKENLSKYQIQIRKGGSDSTANWETIIDDIPTDGILDNTGTMVVDNDKLKAVYTDDSSRIKVYSKINKLSGNMQWRVVAVDKSGHYQYSDTRSLRVNTKQIVASTNNFPLAILNITGLGNPNISTINPSAINDTYYLGSVTPIFYGIAFSDAKVTLTLTDQSCDTTKSTDCTKTYSTIANKGSRFGINIPSGDLKWGKKYTTNMSVALNQSYNELPTFTLSTSGFTSKVSLIPDSKSNLEDSPENSSQQNTVTPTPTPQPAEGQQESPKKKCFLFLCF